MALPFYPRKLLGKRFHFHFWVFIQEQQTRADPDCVETERGRGSEAGCQAHVENIGKTKGTGPFCCRPAVVFGLGPAVVFGLAGHWWQDRRHYCTPPLSLCQSEALLASSTRRPSQPIAAAKFELELLLLGC